MRKAKPGIKEAEIFQRQTLITNHQLLITNFYFLMPTSYTASFSCSIRFLFYR
jgi:hypothetical protein